MTDKVKLEGLRAAELTSAVLLGIMAGRLWYQWDLAEAAFGFVLFMAVVWFTLLRDRLSYDTTVTEEEILAAPERIQRTYQEAQVAIASINDACETARTILVDVTEDMVRTVGRMGHLAADRNRHRALSERLAEVRALVTSPDIGRHFAGNMAGRLLGRENYGSPVPHTTRDLDQEAEAAVSDALQLEDSHGSGESTGANGDHPVRSS